jgi:hypothetical protein
MQLKVFVDDPVCKSREHCPTCRNTSAVGHRFRTRLASVFELPGRSTEFACPFDVPWNVKPLPTPPPTTVPIVIQHKPTPEDEKYYRQLWRELHKRPATARHLEDEDQWLEKFAGRIPCGACKDHFKQLLREVPPDYTTRENYFAWTVEIHNRVNRRLNKPEVSVDEAMGVWKMGTALSAAAPPMFTIKGAPAHMKNLYNNATAFLICGGPSFAQLDHSKLRQPGILTMGVNNSAKTFRPNLWIHVDAPDRFIRSVFFDPTIVKFSPITLQEKQIWDSDRWQWTGKRLKDCPSVVFFQRNAIFRPAEFLTEPTINWGNSKMHGGGRSVMLAAIRILYEIGVRRIYLLGADFEMNETRAYHFAQERTAAIAKGNNGVYNQLQERFTALRPIFERAGLHVFNCNPASKLTAFDHVPYDDAIAAAVKAFGQVDVAAERTAGLYDANKIPQKA